MSVLTIRREPISVDDVSVAAFQTKKIEIADELREGVERSFSFVQDRVKSGELAVFSIGGRATKEEYIA